MGMGMGLPPAKSKNFRGSFLRLLGQLRPEAPRIVARAHPRDRRASRSPILGPKLLGNATNIIFEGVVGKQLPPGVTQEQVIAGLRATGQTQLADMLSGMHVTPGVGVDFAALAQILLVLTGLYLFSAAFSWMQAYIMAGVTQRTVYRLREDVDRKLGRLPLQLLRQPPARRPAEPRHQRHRQHRPVAAAEPDAADHVAAHDRRRADHHVHDQPAARHRSRCSRCRSRSMSTDPHRQPLAEAVRRPVGVDRRAQRPRRGDAHRARDREGVRAPAGGGRDLQRGERAALQRQLPRPVHLRDHPAGDELHLQPELRDHLRRRRPAGRVRPDVARRRRGVHPVLAPVHVPDHPDGEHRQRAPVGRRVGRARVRAARRGARRSRIRSRRAVLGRAGGAVAFEDVSFRYLPDKPLIDDLDLVADAGETVAIVGPTGRRQDDARQPADAVLRDRLRAGSRSTVTTRAS